MKRLPAGMVLGIALLLGSYTEGGAVVIGKYAGEFMATGVGGRPLGMGGAYVALASDVWAGYWNPAGLAELRYPEISIMHSERFAGVVNFDYVGVGLPYGPQSSLALTITRVGVDDIPVTALRNEELKLGEVYEDESGQLVRNVPYVVRTINDAEWAGYLSFARDRGAWAWGANAKFVYKGVGQHSAWGLGFDVGTRLRLADNLLVGAILQDVTTTLLSWDTGRRELISPTLKFGFAWVWQTSFWNIRAIPVLDLDTRFEGRNFSAQASIGPVSLDAHAGLEVQVRNAFVVRVGSDIGRFSAGAGIRLPRLDIDYAFLSHGYLGDTHRVSLRLRLEEARFARPK